MKYKINEDLWNYLKNEIENTEYGEIKIIITGFDSKYIDIVSSERKRFEKENIEKEKQIKLIEIDSIRKG